MSVPGPGAVALTLTPSPVPRTPPAVTAQARSFHTRARVGEAESVPGGGVLLRGHVGFWNINTWDIGQVFGGKKTEENKQKTI